MASNAMLAERPACDFCHLRKIKCDRQLPCANCIEALVDCRRDRPRKSRRSKGARVITLSDRLAALESTVAGLPPQDGPTRRAVPHELPDQETPTNETGSISYSGQQNNECLASRSPVPLGPNARDGLTQQASEGTRFLQCELNSNPFLGTNKSIVMKEAIEFVSRLSTTSRTYFLANNFASSEMGGDFESERFSPELLYMMTMDGEPHTVRHSFWPDHVSFQTLETMCLSLIEGKEDRNNLNCYRVCVYMKAATMLSRLPKKDRSALLRRHLEQSKKQYEREVHKALSEIDYLAPPSLILLQAFLSGALFMQNQGDMSRSWTLAAFASRTLVSLNYHSIDSITLNDESNRDIYGSLYTCYYLDKMLSVLLVRPQSLPKLKIKPTDLVCLDNQLPLSAIIKTMVDFAQVQEGVLDILNHTNKNYQVTVINQLLRDMREVIELIKKYQNLPSFRETTYEWVALEFGYYALLASVLHLKQRVLQDRSTREDCLRASRQALMHLAKILDQHYMNANLLDEYPYSLTWTLLFYPLTAFFVLFCNVIYSPNPDDYGLMTVVTKEIMRFVSIHPAIAEIHKLFSAFLDMVGPLIHGQPHTGRSLGVSDAATSGDESSNPASMTTQYTADPIGSNNSHQSGIGPQDQGIVSQDGPFALDEELLWNLIDSQPWLGWMGSDGLTGDSITN